MDKLPEGLDGLETTAFSTVSYPSCIFLLERPGVFAFERFAYNALRIGVEVLNAIGLADQLEVHFSLGVSTGRPWILNAEIEPVGTLTSPSGYRMGTSPFAPLVLFGISHRIGNKLFDPTVLEEWQSDPRKLLAEIQEIARLVAAAVEEYREKGLGYALRALIHEFDLSLANLGTSVDDFDATVQFIVHHEVAHAYVNQFARLEKDMSDQDFRAFEFIADMVATSWLYRGLIVNTPDSTSYREMRGLSTHAESIRENTKWVLRAQLTVLVFLVLSSAMNHGGKVSLEGGPLHPHTYLRYIMQEVHFMTWVLSNYRDSFDTRELETIDKLSREALNLFITAGLVPIDELDVLFDDTRFADIRRAATIAKELNIAELRGALPLLAQLEAFRPGSISDVNALRFAG